MLKRMLTGILSVVLILGLCGQGFADIIWEPADDYYQANYEECDYLGRSYILNGGDGTVTLYTAPGGRNAVAVLPNGFEMYVSFTTQDSSGRLWGVIQFAYDDNGNPVPNYEWFPEDSTFYSGWAPMDSLSLVYDYEAFREDYGDEFYDYDGDASELSDMDVVVWDYPGSEPGESLLEISGITESMGSVSIEFVDCWTDENGLEWGAVTYYYGWKNFWICLSDPTNAQLEQVSRGEPIQLIEADYDSVRTPDEIDEANDGISVYLIVLAIGIVFIALCVIVYTLGKKNRA